MEAAGSFTSKKGKKSRQCSGDSTRSEPNEASSESDLDPNVHRHEASKKRCERQKSGSLKFSALAYEGGFDEHDHKSAFLPYSKPRTVLTNLQRGNVQTEALATSPVQISFHQRAGKGELTKADLEIGDLNINALDERGFTPLMWSCAYGQVPTVSLLLRSGAIHSVTGPDGETALHMAAAGGHTDILRLLIAAGAPVNVVDDNSNTPLMFAAFGNHAHAINELLNNSADMTMTNLNDDTALSIAIKRSNKEAQAVMEGYLFMLLQPL